MRTSRPRRCAPDLPFIRWRGKTLGLRRRVARGVPSGLGPWLGDPPVRGPGTGSGRGGNSHFAPTLPGSLQHQQFLAGRPSERRFGTRRSNPILLRLCRRCPNCPCRSPASVRLRGGWLRPPTAVLAPTPRSASPLRSAPRPGFTARPRRPPVRGGRPTCRESGCPRRERPPAFLQRTDGPVATRRRGMKCTSQPPQMPQQASKKVGTTGTASVSGTAPPPRRPWRNRKPDNDIARSQSCTSERRFHAHANPFHMCGSIRARLRRFGTSSSLPRRSQASSRKERLNHRSRLEDRLLLQW